MFYSEVASIETTKPALASPDCQKIDIILMVSETIQPASPAQQPDKNEQTRNGQSALGWRMEIFLLWAGN